MIEEKLRLHCGDCRGQAEVLVYSVLAVLLLVAALATIADAGKLLGESVTHGNIGSETLLVLDQWLVVLPHSPKGKDGQATTRACFEPPCLSLGYWAGLSWVSRFDSPAVPLGTRSQDIRRYVGLCVPSARQGRRDRWS
jgi:hypothetical protein